MNCPLCSSSSTRHFWEKTAKKQGRKVYRSCDQCSLVFLSPECRVSPETEKRQYQNHTNCPEEEGYVGFLNLLINPLVERLPLGSVGLDFGSGPGPTLHLLMKQRGFSMEIYDPYFHPDESLLGKTYDFVTSTESAEHFCNPGREFPLLRNLVREEGGIVALMTQIYTDSIHFPDWWYHRDPTHVSFYRPETILWIADWLDMGLEQADANVYFFIRK